MRARVPMDVDLEDRIVFGLTPQRLGYVAVAALAAIAVWHLLPHVGGPLALLVLAAGAAFGWGRWRGSGLDHWVVVATAWTLRNRRVEVDRWFMPYLMSRAGDLIARLPRPRRPSPPEPTLPGILRSRPRIRRLRVIEFADRDR